MAKRAMEDPLHLFESWLAEAKAKGEPLPEAFSLASATNEAKPSVRLLLHKGISGGAFYFYTNFESRKAQELDENPQAAMAFFWPSTNKQVRIEGKVERTTNQESDDYWKTRPRGSQLGAWASKQSEVVSTYEDLEKKMKEVEEKFKDREIPRPHYWGGYKLIPTLLEFWEGLPDRLHKRELFTRSASGWKKEYLAP